MHLRNCNCLWARPLGVAAVVAIAANAHAFDAVSMKQLSADEECPKCDLSDADLRNGSYLGADFSNANLSGANLEGVVMVEATLEGANLRGADLTDAVLEAASLKGADLTGATLTRTSLSGADLSGVTGLTQKQLDQTCDDGSDDPSAATLPKGLILKQCN